jgi:hypothetical protein
VTGIDQAAGLRRLFGGSRQRLVPVAANPFVSGTGAVLEALIAGFETHGHGVLLIDAASSAPAPRELALVDLAACIEPLCDGVWYLAARGLPLAHVDTRGSSSRFIDMVAEAAPQCDVLLLHADATDLVRLLQQRDARPLLLGADHPDAIKHAYACCKLLAQRCELMTFDLLLAASPTNRRVPQIAASLASCADTFLGAVLQGWSAIDTVDIGCPADASLQRLVRGQLALDDHDIQASSLLAARSAHAARSRPAQLAN